MLKVAAIASLAAVLAGPMHSAVAPGSPWNPQTPSYGVDFWREAEGLAQSRIRAIAQTRDGYIWLATDGGLVRFNGETFTAFTIETGSLKDNEVWALQEDDDGGLWIGTYGGGLTLLKDGKFRTFTTADGLPDDVVMYLYKDGEGSLWMITPQGLVRYSHGKFARITPEDGLPEGHTTVMCASGPAGVFAATRGVLYRFAGGRFEALPRVPGGDTSNPEHLLCGEDGSVWISFSDGAIEQRGKGFLKTYRDPRSFSERIQNLFEDPHGGIWAIRNKRVMRLRNGSFEPIPLKDTSAELGSIYTVFMDREGSVWLGLQSNGLARLRTRQLSTVSLEDGLPDDRTRAVFEDSRGAIWIGTFDGLARYDHGRLSKWMEAEGTRLGDVRSVAEDAKGTIWVAADKALLSMKDDRLARVPGWTDTFEIEVLYKDAQGRIWIGTDGAGLFEYFGGAFRNYRTQDGLGSNHVRAIMGDRHGALWISTFGKGLTKYQNGVFTSITTQNGLSGDRVVAMHEDEQGALWFATRRGLSRLKDGKFFTWTSESGMFTGFVYSIVDDGRGNFWFSSAQGIFRVSKRELRGFANGTVKKIVSVAYGERDGMKTRAGNLGNQPSAMKTSSGQLMFSSMNGLVVVDPDRVNTNTFVPPVYIEKVLLNRKERPANQYAQLPLGAGEVEIHYAALSYSDPEKVRFKYMLEGFDKDWIDAGDRRFTYYANLSPGNYRFRVIAGKADGLWNESGAEYSFYLQPPFYRKPAFAAIVITPVMFLVWLAYWLRMRGLRVRYSAVLAERNRISRDIHDTLAQNLAGIALQLDAVQMYVPEINGGLRERLDQACNLTRYSLAEARRAIADLRSDELEGPELAVALPEIAHRLGAALQTRIEVTGAPRKLHPNTERNLLRIFQEALANVVKHAHARTLDVELRYAANGLALRVCDDGRGFDPENVDLAGNGHYGLIGMRERAERIGGHLTLHSTPGGGTELLIEVPL